MAKQKAEKRVHPKPEGFEYLRGTSFDYLKDADHPHVDAEYNDTDPDGPALFPSNAEARGRRITGYRYQGNARHFPRNSRDYVRPQDVQQRAGNVPRKGTDYGEEETE